MKTKQADLNQRFADGESNEQKVLSASEKREIAKELGLRANAPIRKVVLTGGHYGAKFRNYTIEIIGLEVDRMPQPCPWPCLLLELFHQGSGERPRMREHLSLEPGSRLYEARKIRPEGLSVTQIWRTRVRYEDSKVFIDWLWHPKRGFTITLFGLEDVPPKRRVEEGTHALNGAALIQIAERRGRGIGSYKIRGETITARVRESYKRYMDENQERPSQKQLAEVMFISERTLYRYRKRYKIPWPPL